VVCDNYYFIESGAIRYYQMKDGEEITGGFFLEGSGYTDLDSFLSNSFSKQTAQAIECSSLLFITKLDLEKLYQEVPKFERIARILTEEAFIDLRKKADNFILLDAKKRYLDLLKNRPELTRRIPQHYIASYLGIKPQSLSRIRKNL
jgi:CRP-like cAMP-binding protein